MIRAFTEKLDFPEEATSFLEHTYEKILFQKDAMDNISKAMDCVFCSDSTEDFTVFLDTAALKCGVNKYTFHLIFWIMCAKPLYYIYKAKNLPEELYWDSMLDLKYKMNDCKKRFCVWGVSSVWFKNFFCLKRFAFGRLQYDISKWEDGDYKGFLSNGDPVFICHIPSGSPLLPDAVISSFKMLYSFYKDKLKDGILAIKCTSWLIYPPFAQMVKETSNMRKFYEMFDIIDLKIDTRYLNFWSIFGVENSGPDSLKNAPDNTSLRREMKKYLLEGKNVGAGLGVILFDGEKIINK